MVYSTSLSKLWFQNVNLHPYSEGGDGGRRISLGSVGSDSEGEYYGGAAAAAPINMHDPYAVGPAAAEGAAAGAGAGGGGSSAVAVEPLDPHYDKPEGLDISWFDRLVEYRERKIASEEECSKHKVRWCRLTSG